MMIGVLWKLRVVEWTVIWQKFEDQWKWHKLSFLTFNDGTIIINTFIIKDMASI